MNNKKKPTSFKELNDEDDKDLTMFTIKNLSLDNDKENINMVVMTLVLKRKVVTELLTTYLPTILLLLITFVTIFFDESMFGDAIAVNLTIMLVMTTIFTSKIEELPPTSDMKMIDIWLIFCLVVPFLEVILRTAIECMNCSCHICEPKDANKAEKEDKKKEVGAIQEASSGEVSHVWVGTRVKVAPQQVAKNTLKDRTTVIILRKVENKGREALLVESSKVEKVAGQRCWKRVLLGVLQNTGEEPFFFFLIFPSEMWILPTVTLLVLVAYAGLAIVFYNKDG